MKALTIDQEGVKVFTLPEEPKLCSAYEQRKCQDLLTLEEMRFGCECTALQNKYRLTLAQAKSSAILVKDQEMAKIYIKGFLVKSGQNVLIENGKDYPIPGLKYTVENIPCELDDCWINGKCCHSEKCNSKQVAILSLEETSEEMDDKFRQASKKFIDSAPSKEFKVTPVSDGETQEELITFFKELYKNQQPIPPDIQAALNKTFFDLL